MFVVKKDRRLFEIRGTGAVNGKQRAHLRLTERDVNGVKILRAEVEASLFEK